MENKLEFKTAEGNTLITMNGNDFSSIHTFNGTAFLGIVDGVETDLAANWGLSTEFPDVRECPKDQINESLSAYCKMENAEFYCEVETQEKMSDAKVILDNLLAAQDYDFGYVLEVA